MRVLELLKTWEKGVGVECWSASVGIDTVAELLNLIFVTKFFFKKRIRGCRSSQALQAAAGPGSL